MTLGEKLQALRKQAGLSQEALAGKVNVTRQTISKWELNLSTPELGILVRLSELYGVSMDYLTKEDSAEPVRKTGRRAFCWPEKGKRVCFAWLSALGITGAFACFICDYFTSGKLGWSWIVALSILVGVGVLLPFFRAKGRVLFKTLLMVSLVPVPYLAGLALLLKRPIVLSLGGCIALAAIADLWCLYGVCRRIPGRPWRATGVGLLVLLPMPFVVTALVAIFLPQVGVVDLYSDLFNAVIMVLLALACFWADARKEGTK